MDSNSIICCGCLLLIVSVFGEDSFYFSTMPKSQDVVEGSDLTIKCDVSDRQHIVFQWMFRGKILANTSRRFQDNSNLRILRVSQEDDDGPFTCIATNVTTGFSLQSSNARLNIQWINETANVILKRPARNQIKAGSDVILRCVIQGNPVPSILWYRNKFRIFNTDKNERIKIMEDESRLKLSQVTASENGVYSCRAENIAGARDSKKKFLLNVEEPGVPHLAEEKFLDYVLVQRNEPARLDCLIVGAARIEWFSNYEKIINSSRFGPGFESNTLEEMRYYVFSNGSLFFPSVQPEDKGIYRCEGISAHHPKQVFTAELEMAYLGDFTPDLFEPRLITDFPMVIPVHSKFEVKVYPATGKPKPTYRWLNRNNMPIGEMGMIRVEDSTLVFEDPEEIDTGNYTCIMSNSAGEKKQNVWIMISVPPIITKVPQPRTVSEDMSVSFSCKVIATPYPVTTIFWTRNDVPIDPTTPGFRVNKKVGTLYIASAQAEDSGSYACVANTTGQPLEVSSRAYLTVKKKLRFSPAPEDHRLELSFESTIECKAEAETRPAITWLKDGREQFPTHVSQDKGVLYFHGVRKSDAGYYTCIAVSERQGIINATITVEVVEKPKFQVLPRNTTAYEGRRVMLHCVAIGDPKPSVWWDKNGEANTWDLARFEMLGNGTLLISKVFMEDKGRYGCTANNTAGLQRYEAYLDVASAAEYEKTIKQEDSFNMMKTVIIAVCSAGAYLALVIGLTAFCSYRLLMQRRNRKAFSPRKGLYGDVFLAQARNIRESESESLVVVKSLLNKDEQLFFEFKHEMDMFSRLEHPNITKLLGVCREAEPNFMITEYCDWGDLKQFLLATRNDNGKRIARAPPLTIPQKLNLCRQVSLGMEHLASNRFIHKDLASRNVLLTNRLDVKISLLSLCRDVYAQEYYPHFQCLIPLRWMPPEAVLDDEFSTKSDVWSFGVFMWEVFHLGELPHKSKTNEELLKCIKVDDISLDICDQCLPGIAELIRKCTQLNAKDRPQFNEISIALGELNTENNV
ncbi:inactive tyrosine-protein kinase 7 [Octopus bimaculoides]|uniref:inactive tyrosine-protein kinase 7 n=1 Tax=Octopus bimaculoides TaxID=37653 RepID=UPI00071DD015|nr:inactive tyrosine-protein kinase 7 [Octopus bimaculoides]|eukprot:XP_014785291.1 PREDICTED: inactive tyrosine-protein kinase 7-like [Octopus bimaculoides]